MLHTKTIRVGKRGTLVLPAPLRRRFGLEEDALIIVESHDQGVLLRPAIAVPVDVRRSQKTNGDAPTD